MSSGGEPATSDPRQPSGTYLEGRNVALRPVSPADYEPLRQIELSDELGPNWRQRGVTPSPESYPQNLWTGVVAQFIVVQRDVMESRGLVVAYDADFRDQHLKLAVAKFAKKDLTPTVLGGVMLFLDYLFRSFPLRKIYAESLEPNFAHFASNRLFEQEGRLREHSFLDNRYVDLLILSLTRSRWEAERANYAPLFLGTRAAT